MKFETIDPRASFAAEGHVLVKLQRKRHDALMARRQSPFRSRRRNPAASNEAARTGLRICSATLNFLNLTARMAAAKRLGRVFTAAGAGHTRP